MAVSRMARLARVLGLTVALLAWLAAAARYRRDGAVRWELIAAGALFAALPFGMAGRGGPPR